MSASNPVGRTFTDEAGNSCLTLPFGFSIDYGNETDYVSKLLYFAPMVDSMADAGMDIMCAAMGIVGCLGWGNRRRAKRFLREASQAADKLANAFEGPGPGDRGIPKVLVPNSPEANEAAENQARSWQARFAKGGMDAVGAG